MYIKGRDRHQSGLIYFIQKISGDEGLVRWPSKEKIRRQFFPCRPWRMANLLFNVLLYSRMKFLILNKWTGFFLFFSSRETDWCVDRWHIIIKYIRTSSNSLRVLYIYHVKLTVGEMSIGQWARFPLFISQVSFSCMQMSPHLSNSFICVRRQKRFDRSIFKRFKDSMYRPSRPVLYGQWFAILFQLRNDRYISITFHCAQIKISNICTEKRKNE